MTSATNMTKEPTDATPDLDTNGNGDSADSSIEVAVDGDAKRKPAPAVKKPLGAKDAVPFQWKLVGRTRGAVVTLFKSADRHEVEAQLERITKEGYYRNLRILDINTKVVQPKRAKSKTPGPRAKAPAKATAAKTRATTRRTAKPNAKPAGKPSSKKTTRKKSPAKKAPAKASKKKTGRPKRTTKRTAKKS